ncbi:hypothetical protein RHSIM_RhsimUnG0002600 [Rhododendron simsii]|uniref:Uncharacterized protein n=1 Tax=Rhododendron simsii TaxID=118357 RepID=A0A834L5B1_RHOSS|nr:hypothetical protein RHSIM_RhsimUnG0002600 [Rhododendron simsii]
MTFRRWLDNLTGVSVRAMPYMFSNNAQPLLDCRNENLERRFIGDAGIGLECLVRSREVTKSRVLLECPLGWQWYLGDWVTCQSLGLPMFVVLESLPPRVQRTDTYTRAELEQFTLPDTNLEGLLRRAVSGTVAGGMQDRGGHSQRGRDHSISSRSRGRDGAEATTRSEDAPEASGIPDLKWEISVRDRTGAQAIVDIPQSRESAESAIMRMLGMRKLLRNCVMQVQVQMKTRCMTRAQSQAATGSPMPRVTLAEGR